MAVAIGRTSLRAQALADLRDDFDELRFLCDVAPGRSRRLQAWSRELETLPPTAPGRDRYAELIRREYGSAAARTTADDWQSPSFGHSLRSQAGRLEGRTGPHVTDYKRDRHADAAEYERAYLREYVRAPDVRAFATSCGMAALTTILAFLDVEGPVVLGGASYHETKELVLAAFAGRVAEVDEADLLGTLDELRPGALFVDSLCNSRGLAVPPLGAILEAADCWVVVDNTCLGPSCRPFDSTAPRLLVWESLLKLAQFGLDRTNAGILLARGPGTHRLDSLREHLGTNVSDTSILSVPVPDRGRLERRLARLERNAAILAEGLGGFHPGVGPLLQLDVPEPQAWIPRALEQARHRNARSSPGRASGSTTHAST